jgi:hypothetical protein
VNANSLARKLDALLLAAIAACWLFGCDRGRTVDLHYAVNGGEPRTVNLFFPARIAVAPAAMPPAMDLGAVFDAQGYRETTLKGGDLSRQAAEVIAKSLALSGLRPEIMNASPGDLPVGIDFVLTSSIESLHCIKRHIGGSGEPKDAFMMFADARLKFALAGRGGPLYSATESSQLAEPPQGADIAKYKPQFTDPADAASAVVTRTAAKLIADPEFQQVLPRRAMPSAAPAPSAAPTPAAPGRTR